MSLRPKRINFDEAFKELKRNLDKLYDFSGLDKVSGMYMHEYPSLWPRWKVSELSLVTILSDFLRFTSIAFFFFRSICFFLLLLRCLLDHCYQCVNSHTDWCMTCVMHLLNHIPRGCSTLLQSSWKIVHREFVWYESIYVVNGIRVYVARDAFQL